MRDVGLLKDRIAGVRRDRPLRAVGRDDHAIARLVVHADEIEHVTMERRRLALQPRDVPHLHVRVVEDLRRRAVGHIGSGGELANARPIRPESNVHQGELFE